MRTPKLSCQLTYCTGLLYVHDGLLLDFGGFQLLICRVWCNADGDGSPGMEDGDCFFLACFNLSSPRGRAI